MGDVSKSMWVFTGLQSHTGALLSMPLGTASKAMQIWLPLSGEWYRNLSIKSASRVPGELVKLGMVLL